MREMLEEITKALVDKPEEVVVSEHIEDGTCKLSISVADEDIGKVIGKKGRIANSIRTIAKAAGTKKDLLVTVEILD